MVAQPTDSIGQVESSVNPPTLLYYSVPIRARVRAAQAKLTPEEIEAANYHAAKLRAQDATLLAGPQLAGNCIVIPSWCWMPEAVREWKARGGWFQAERAFTHTIAVQGKQYTVTVMFSAWVLDARRAKLDEVTEIYRRVFFREIGRAEMSARLAGTERM